MSSVVLGSAALVMVNTLMTIFCLRRIHAWEERDFTNLLVSWKTMFLACTGLSIACTSVALMSGGTWWQAGIISLLSWMLPLVVNTDYATYKIPREPSILAYYLPLAVAIPLAWSDGVALVSAAVFFGVIGLLYVVGALMGGGIGFADIRLFLLTGTALSWWVGLDWMMYAFGLSAGAQLLIFAVSKFFGWGRIKVRGEPTPLSIEESHAFRQRQNLRRAQMSAMARFKDRLFPSEGSPALPFGPAILGTYLIMALVAVFAERNACSFAEGIFCMPSL